MNKGQTKQAAGYLVLGIVFFITLGWALYTRAPTATPEVLIDVRDAHDSLLHQNDSLKAKLKKTMAVNNEFRQKLNRLYRLDTMNVRLTDEINQLTDSLKRVNEKPPVIIRPDPDPELSKFFSNEYQ